MIKGFMLGCEWMVECVCWVLGVCCLIDLWWSYCWLICGGGRSTDSTGESASIIEFFRYYIC